MKYLLLLLLLSGCSTPVACGHVHEWPKSTQQQIAAELKALPADATLNYVIADYIVLRDEARACRKGLGL